MAWLMLAGKNLAVFLVASAVLWLPGQKIINLGWQRIVRYGGVDPNHLPGPSALGGAVGSLEGSFYVFAVMADKLELITGWLVMKAFFGWIRVPTTAVGNHSKYDKRAHFNGYLIGNLLSLFVGLGCGYVAKQLIDVTWW